MYQIPENIAEHIEDPHVIGIFIGDEQEPALSSLDDLASCVYNARFCGGGLTIGTLCSANVSISAYGQHDLSGRDIVVKLGFGDPLEWLQLGAFRVCELHVGDDTTSITAYDAAYWATGGEYVPTVQIPTSVRAVLEDVCEQCGIPFGELPSSADRIIDGPLTGFTARQTIMNMAAVCGCNALIARDGALCLKWLSDNEQTVGPDEYYADELTNAATINIVGVQMKTKVTTPSTDPDTGITVEREEEKTYSSASGTGRVLSVDCPYANQDLVDAVADAVVPLSYSIGSVSFIGGYDVEPGDVLTVTSLNGTVHSVPVLGLTLSLDGGCRATVKAEGDSDTDTRANFDTEYQQAISRLEAAIIAVKNLTADNIEAQSAYIKSLSADEAFIDRIFANDITATGTISGVNLNGATGSFKETLEVWAASGMGGGKIRLSADGPNQLGGSYYTERVADEIPQSYMWTSRLTDAAKFPQISTPQGYVVAPAFYGAALYESPHIDAGFISGDKLFALDLYAHSVDAYTISEGGKKLEEKYAAKSHSHSYLPITGGTMTGPIEFNRLGANSIYNGSVDGASGVGGELNNLVFRSWNGISFTTSVPGAAYTDKNAVSINCRSGALDAATLKENGVSLGNKYLPLTGGTLTGTLTGPAFNSPQTYSRTSSSGPNMVIGTSGIMYRSTSSSRRYKTDIVDLPLEAVQGLYRLPVREFRYKDGYTSEEDERYRQKIPGLIAEELDEILPIAVDHMDGKAEMWNSNIMIPCLLRLAQDLNERVEALEKRIEALERKE